MRDRTAVITGASSGLGKALALHLAGSGARLYLAARRREKLEAAAAQCREAGAEHVVAIPTDVTSPEDCARLMNAAGGAGGIDYLVLNAGISMWARFEDSEDLALYRRLIEVNYLGAVHCTHAALPHLRRTGGLIAAISSIQGSIPVPLHAGYVASKHALEGFLDTLRMELDGSGVGILVVQPHWLRGSELRASALAADGKPMGEHSRGHSSESIAVDDAAGAIVRAMQARRKRLVIPPKLRILPWLKLAAPGLLHAIIRRKMAEQLEQARRNH